jgi:type II restriction enzyme
MNRQKIIPFIASLARNKGQTFNDCVDEIEKIVSKLSMQEIKISLLECGVIPESFAHDSTEEKLYAKYSDILLARAFSCMGIVSKAIKERADAADVEGKTTQYTMVVDGKVFRLSRTAKNQKDFKVEALDKWRKGKDFACLISPLYQYPKSKSQIYTQAIGKNVTLLSYIHIYFILCQDHPEKFSYKDLWLVGKSMKKTKEAAKYWEKIDETLCRILNKDIDSVRKIKRLETELLKKAAEAELSHINDRIESIKSLSHNEAIGKLIKTEKLDKKIIQIKKMVGLK